MNKRKFKFRAWDDEEKLMHYFPRNTHMHLCGFVELHNSEDEKDSHITLMQWTGFTDSEGRDIYEGDVVEHTPGYPWIVRWSSGSGEWQIVTPSAMNTESLSIYPYNAMIMGNIYENKELLEEEND